MRKIVLILLCCAIASPSFSQEAGVKKARRRGEVAGYSTREATALSMMGWGLVLSVGIATFVALIDHGSSSDSGGSGGGTTGHNH